MGESLPQNWVEVPLGQVCEIHDSTRVPINATERSARVSGKNTSELFPYYGATGQVGWIDDFLFQGEYVLVGEDGAPFLDPLRNTAYIAEGKFWVNNHAHILRSSTSNNFLCHYLNQVNYADHVTGTTRLKLNQSALKRMPVRLAPFAEQRRIVAKIDELFSELDKGVESLETAREQLIVYREAVLKHAFEGKLTAKWREANKDKLESADQLLERIKAERKARYQEQMESWKASVEKWEADGKEGKKPAKPKNQAKSRLSSETEPNASSPLPFGWMYVNLGHLIDEPKYGTSKKCGYQTEGTGVIRIPNVIAEVIDSTDLKFAEFDDDEAAAYALQRGDILMIRSNGSISIVGRCALVSEKDEDYLYAGYLIRIRPNPKVATSEYLVSVMASHNLRSQIETKAKSTSGVNNINSGEIQDMVVPICSATEQRVLVSQLSAALSELDSTEREVEAQLQTAQVLRQSILKKAFAGQLVPQDPNDEPASILLERIRSELTEVKSKSRKPTVAA